MEDTIVGFEVAKLAKEVDFNVGVNHSYIIYKKAYIYDDDPNHRESVKKGEIEMNSHYHVNNYKGIDLSNNLYDCYAAPTQSLLQKWLREVYKIDVEIRFIGYADLSLEYHTKVNFIKDGLWEYILVTKNKSNLDYREALEIGLMAGLKLIKNK